MLKHQTNKSVPKTEQFSDEEILRLETDFIETYIKNEKRPMHTLIRLYARYWGLLLVSLLFFIIKSSPGLVLPVVTANLINLAVEQPPNVLSVATWNIALILFLLILNVPTHTLHINFQSIVLRRVEAGLRAAMVRKLQQLTISFHKVMQSGRIQSKLMRDVETVQSLATHLFASVPGLILNITTATVLLLTRSPKLFIFILLCVPSNVLLLRLFRKRMKKYNSQFRRDMESTSADLMEMVEMTPITRAHAVEQYEIKKIGRRLNAVANTGHHLDVVNACFGSLSWVTITFFQLACLAFSCYQAYHGHIAVGDISLFQSYFVMLIGQVSAILNLFPAITQGLESVSSIGEILGALDIEDDRGKRPLNKLNGEFDFQNVRFHYDADHPVLNGLDLHVKAGETIAIVGGSGAGKSTILNLLIGFNKPVSGRITVDGQDIEDIDLHSYRRHLAIVPQTSVLFTGTIRDNITYGLPSVSEERLLSAVQAAHLTEFIASLPQGLDTMLDEHGGNLSGGQRQRISIARAIIRDPRIIIFDEATSALDTVSEKEIQAAINNLTENRTTFIVAHRLSTIRNADRIAVIKDGRCAEIGTFDELMAKKGEYYHLQTLQDGTNE